MHEIFLSIRDWAWTSMEQEELIKKGFLEACWFCVGFLFFDVDHILKSWICYNIASVLCFGFLSRGMWDLGALTRDWIRSPFSGRWGVSRWTRELPGVLVLLEDKESQEQRSPWWARARAFLVTPIQCNFLGLKLKCEYPLKIIYPQKWKEKVTVTW